MEKPKLKIWTIYFSPADFPGQWIAREFILDQPTKNIFLGPSVVSLRNSLLNYSDHELYRIPRSENDHPSVIESWI
jgi:hypothetical protein